MCMQVCREVSIVTQSCTRVLQYSFPPERAVATVQSRKARKCRMHDLSTEGPTSADQDEKDLPKTKDLDG